MTTSTPDIARIAAGLSEAQEDALLGCTPWDVDALPAGIAARFCKLGFLQESTIIDDGVELTPLAFRVRKHILEKLK